MTRHVKEGCAIECEKADIKARKISNAPSLFRLFNDKTLYWRYKTQKSCGVTILEELFPKKAKVNNNSMLDKDTEIAGEVVEIILEKRVKTTVLSNYSHVHGIQSCIYTGFVYASICIPWRFMLNREKILFEPVPKSPTLIV